MAKYLKWCQNHKEDDLPRKLLATDACPGVASPLFTFPFEAWEKIYQSISGCQNFAHTDTGIVTGNSDEKRYRGLNIFLPWALLGKLKTSLPQGDDYKIMHRNGRTLWLTYSLHEPSGPDIIGHFFPQTAIGKGLKWAISLSQPMFGHSISFTTVVEERVPICNKHFAVEQRKWLSF